MTVVLEEQCELHEWACIKSCEVGCCHVVLGYQRVISGGSALQRAVVLETEHGKGRS